MAGGRSASGRIPGRRVSRWRWPIRARSISILRTAHRGMHPVMLCAPPIPVPVNCHSRQNKIDQEQHIQRPVDYPAHDSRPVTRVADRIVILIVGYVAPAGGRVRDEPADEEDDRSDKGGGAGEAAARVQPEGEAGDEDSEDGRDDTASEVVTARMSVSTHMWKTCARRDAPQKMHTQTYYFKDVMMENGNETTQRRMMPSSTNLGSLTSVCQDSCVGGEGCRRRNDPLFARGRGGSSAFVSMENLQRLWCRSRVGISDW